MRNFLLLLAFLGAGDGRTSAQENRPAESGNPEPAKSFNDQPLHRFDVKTGTLHPLDDGESIADFTEPTQIARQDAGARQKAARVGGKKQSEQIANAKDANRDPSRVVIRSAGSGGGSEVARPVPAQVAQLRIGFSALSSFKLNRPYRSAAVRFPWVYALDRDGGLYWFKLSETPGVVESVVTTYFRDNAGDGLDLAIHGETLVCTRGSRLAVYSLSDPSSPRETETVGPMQPPARCRGVVINGSRFYLLYGNSILTFEMLETGKIAFRGLADVEGDCLAASFVGSILYCAVADDPDNWITKIVGLDASDPLHFKPLGNCQLTGYPFHIFSLDSETFAALYEGEARVAAVDGNTTILGNAGWIQLFECKDARNLAPVGEPVNVHPRAAAPLGQDLVVTSGHVYRRTKARVEPVLDFYLGSTLDGAPYHGRSDGKYAALASDESITILSCVKSTPMAEPAKE